jgi:predicted DCC family thiol-disulfide oxidoreductase YuxK
MQNLPNNKKIILFDGICNLCNSSVQYVIKNDKKDIFRFVSLQSDLGKKIIQHIGIDIAKCDSIILYEPGIAYYYKSEAVFKISNELGGWHIFLNILKLFPVKIRNILYDYIAKNRHQWYGKSDSCMIPNKEILSKFL